MRVILVSSDVHMLPNLSPRDELHLEKHVEVKFIKIAVYQGAATVRNLLKFLVRIDQI